MAIFTVFVWFCFWIFVFTPVIGYGAEGGYWEEMKLGAVRQLLAIAIVFFLYVLAHTAYYMMGGV